MPQRVVRGGSGPNSSAVLEERIDALEISLGAPSETDLARILQERSSLETELASLKLLGRDVRAERSRLDTLDNAIRSRAAMLVGLADRSGGMAALRAQAQPAQDHWWWWLDGDVAESRRSDARRTIGIVVLAAIVLFVVGFAMDRLGGSPEEQKAATHSAQGANRISQGDYTGAIEAYEESVTVIDAQPEIWASLAVLYETQGETAKAAAALARAEELVADTAALESVLARSYELVRDCEAALQHGERAVAADQAFPQAYLARGSALECLEQWEPALADYQRAADLALEQDQDGVYVLAKTRLGMLVQMRVSALPTMQP
jgi:tetratricopeptide (TPR) repeat protein